jgi:hypothetical protein
LSMARNILDHQKATHVDQQIPCTIVLDWSIRYWVTKDL